MRKGFFQIGGGLLFLIFILGEGIGRYYGLTSYPLYQASAAYEYIHIPNQKVKIYGNRYETNEFSMRSKPLLPTDTTVVLLIGDSIVNGGNQTDQDSLASSILENRLSRYFNRRIRVLNIAEGSWGPDNAAAYISEKGVFHADFIVLVFSSDDAYDIMAHQPVVGVNGQYPDKQASLAWEVLLPKAWGRVKYALSIGKKKKNTNVELDNGLEYVFNPGLQQFKVLRDTTAIPLHLYLHAGVKEMENKKLTEAGTRIVDFCNSNKIPYTIELDTKLDRSHFMDKIHYNNKGQKLLADNLFPLVKAELLKIPPLSSTIVSKQN